MTDPGALVCNIDHGGARRRGLMGALAAGATLAAAAWVLASGAPLAWRLVLFPLAYGAALGLLQARGKT